LQSDQAARQRNHRPLARAGLCVLAVLALHGGLLHTQGAGAPTTLRPLTEPVRVRSAQPTPSRSTTSTPPTPAQPAKRTASRGPARTPQATPTAAALQTPAPTLDLRPYLPPAAALAYRWQQGALDEPALLQWHPEGEHYSLRLSTPGTEVPRPAAWWHSQGRLDTTGVLPARHTARRSPGSERALTFVRDERTQQVLFSARTTATPVPPQAQDSLSWLPHFMALVAAGQRQALITVAEVGGSVQDWWLQADPAEPWRWDRSAETLEQTQVTLWLCPQPPHWPARLRLVPAWGAAMELQLTTPCDGASFE